MKNFKQAMLVTASAVLLASVLVATPFIQQNETNIGEEIGAQQAQKISKVTLQMTANLNMRTLANTKGKVLVTIPKGTKVSSDTKVGTWYKVSFKGKTGYISGTYTKKVTAPKAAPKKPTPKPAPKPAPKAPTVTAKSYQTTANLNVRSTASAKGKWLVTIPKGKTVKASVKQNGWYKVSYGKKTGWVSGSYLKEVKPAAKPTPKPTVKPKPVPKSSPASWMSRSQAEGILAKSMEKQSGGHYTLEMFDQNLSTVSFYNNSDAKGIMTVNTLRYISGSEIKPTDFGQKSYDATKESLRQMDASILAFAETQLGAGTAQSKQLASDFRYFLVNSEREAKAYKTYSGKTFELFNASGYMRLKFLK